MRKKQKQWRWLILVLVLAGCLTGALSKTAQAKTSTSNSKYVMKNSMYYLGTVKKKSIVYTEARTSSKKVKTVKKDEKILVRAKGSIKGTSWYKVVVSLKNRTQSGYIKAKCIKLVSARAKTTQKKTAVVRSTTYLYRLADTTASVRTQVKKKSTVQVLGYVKVLGRKWAKCRVKVNKNWVTGYAFSSKIKETDDVDFEKTLCDFPSSYRSALRKLHAAHPKWKFVAVNTGIDWETAVANEDTLGKSTIASYVPAGGSAGTWSAPFSYLSKDNGNYNWENDTFVLKDSPYFYSADTKVVKYYMDPRNSLNDESIFQFESLSYDSSQTQSGVKGILKGTFMNGSYSVKDALTKKTDSNTYAKAFLSAGKASGVSAYFLASRARQELGTYGSGSVSGKFSFGGRSFAGYYNYYNIKANDSSIPNQNIANGLTYAMQSGEYGRPWSSITKAIKGGALFFADNYVSKGQNTVYFQKFNVVTEPLYWHQYMTAVQAPTSESKSKYKAYSEYGIIDNALTFYIPVYKNMPDSPSQLPASTGNTNSFIRSITIRNSSGADITNSVTPTFNYKSYTYEMVVKSNVGSITIEATPASSRSSVSGTGTYGLEPGKTKKISLNCTSESGNVTTYTIKVARKNS